MVYSVVGQIFSPDLGRTGNHKQKYGIVTSIRENVAWGTEFGTIWPRKRDRSPTHTHFGVLGEWHERFEQTYVDGFEEFSILVY